MDGAGPDFARDDPPFRGAVFFAAAGRDLLLDGLLVVVANLDSGRSMTRRDRFGGVGHAPMPRDASTRVAVTGVELRKWHPNRLSDLEDDREDDGTATDLLAPEAAEGLGHVALDRRQVGESGLGQLREFEVDRLGRSLDHVS